MTNTSDSSQRALERFPCGGTSCQFGEELTKLRVRVDELTELVRTDALTGLFNYRFLMETLSLEMERTRRGTQPLALAILDIDFFKKFNDRWGHEMGNLALTHVANLIKIATRKLDYPCRFGGEEFVLLLPNTELIQAVNVADRLRESIAATPLILESGEQIQITASMGVDVFTARHAETPEGFIHRVDLWLYKAKEEGRNRVCGPDGASLSPQAVSTEEKAALFDLLRDSN